MRLFSNAELTQKSIIQSPTDIIMAAEIILEEAILRQPADLFHLVLQQPDITCRQRMPRCAHSRYIIQNVTFRLLCWSEIRNDFPRFHNHLAKKRNVDIRLYSIIYELIEDITDALAGKLAPEKREKTIGEARILQIFELSNGQKVCGCRVESGIVKIDWYDTVRESVVSSLRQKRWMNDAVYTDAVYAYRGIL